MRLKNKFIKLALLATIFPTAIHAQETMPVSGLTINGEQPADLEQWIAQEPVQTTQNQPAQKQGLMIPKSLQKQVQPAPVQQAEPLTPVSVLPPMVSPLQELAPTPGTDVKKVVAEDLNKDQLLTERSFKEQFAANPDDTLTMEKLLSDAYARNPSINASRDAVRAVDETYYQALAGFLPRVDYTLSQDRETTTPIGGVEDTFTTSGNSFNLSQGIFGGGESLYAVKSARNRIKSAQSELKNAEQKFLTEAINAYVNYIFTQKVRDLASNNVNVLGQQLHASKERFVVGDATKTDVAQSEARLANARSSYSISEGDFVNAKANFKRIFGVEAPETLPMPTKLPDIPGTLEDSLKLSESNNPELNQFKYLLESRESDIGVQRSQLLPQVDLRGSIGESETPTSAGIFSNDSETVGVNVRVPIYDAGITWSRTREARDRRNQVKEQYNDTYNSVRSAVVQAWKNIDTTAANIESTRASLAASEFALEGVTEEQKEGARTILDVLDAEQERFSAEISHARAIKDSVLAIYAMKSVLGELTPKELGLSVKEYNPEEHYKNTRFKFIGL